MSTALEDRMREFARALLERHGAVVDWPAFGSGQALLPGNLARTLHVAEEAALTTEAAPGKEALSVNLATDFLELVEPLIGAHPTVARLRLDGLYLKKSAMDEPVARFFGFPNARVRVLTALPKRMAYHCWHFSAVVDSEDRWEELVEVRVNAATGAEVDFADPLTMLDALPGIEEPAGPEPNLEAARRKAALAAVLRASAFLARLESRLERDRRRIREYYEALLQEASPARQRVPVDPDRLEEKRRAVDVEMRRRLMELDERYALRLRLDPVALVELDMPVLEVELEVLRRPARGTVRVYWNPLRKELEPLACAECGRNITMVRFDESLRALCAGCAA